MLKWLEKFILKRIIKRITKSLANGKEEIIEKVEGKTDEILEELQTNIGQKVVLLVGKAIDGVCDTQK